MWLSLENWRGAKTSIFISFRSHSQKLERVQTSLPVRWLGDGVASTERIAGRRKIMPQKLPEKSSWCQYQNPLSPPKTSVRTLWHVAFPVGTEWCGTPPRLWHPDISNVFLPPGYCGLTHPGCCEPGPAIRQLLLYARSKLLSWAWTRSVSMERRVKWITFQERILWRLPSMSRCSSGLWSPWVCIFVLTPKVLCSEGAIGILPGIILGRWHGLEHLTQSFNRSKAGSGSMCSLPGSHCATSYQGTSVLSWHNSLVPSIKSHLFYQMIDLLKPYLKNKSRATWSLTISCPYSIKKKKGDLWNSKI